MIEILLFIVLALVAVNLALSVVLLARKRSNTQQPDHRSEYLKRKAERDKRRAAIRKRAGGR